SSQALDPFVIQPASPLPPLTKSAVIDGYTQPGASPNTLGSGDNAVFGVVLDGSLAGASDGLVIAADNSAVRGLVINGFAGAGVKLNGSANAVTGNFIGTDATGGAAASNTGGIEIRGANNLVGGVLPSERNVISGNQSNGILIQGAGATGNIIQ